MTADRRAAAIDAVAITAAVAIALALGEFLAQLGGIWASAAGLISAGAMVGLPLLWTQHRKLTGDILAVDPPLLRSAWHGVAVALVVLPIYAMGFDAWQTHVLHKQRGSGIGLLSPGLDWQGEPARGVPLAISEARDGVVVHNHTNRVLAVRVAERHRPVPASGRVRVELRAGERLDVVDTAGVRQSGVQLGASGSTVELPVEYAPNFYWLFLLLIVQIAAVALPEELLFRGFVLTRLRVLWPPQRKLLGVPFGLAHVGSAARFAVVHLVAVPAPFRLAVFFPGLLFAWIAERSRSSLAAAVNHALCNAMLAVLLRLYPP